MCGELDVGRVGCVASWVWRVGRWRVGRWRDVPDPAAISGNTLQPRYNAIFGSHRMDRVIGQSHCAEAFYDGANGTQP